MRHRKSGAANRREHLEVEVGDPVVVGNLIDPSSGAPACVVHQPVKSAPPVDRRGNKPLQVSRARDIGLHRKSVTPGVTQPLLGGGQPARIPPADRDPGPLLDEATRQRRPQPVGPASDKHNLAIQVQIH